MGKIISKLFGFLQVDDEPKKKELVLECRPNVVSWGKFDSNIDGIIQDAKKQGIDTKKSIRLRCKLVPEPSNKADKKAIKVMAKIPVDNLRYKHVGYISSGETTEVRKYFPYVESGEYYWLLFLKLSRSEGADFTLSLEKSKLN